MEQLQSLSLRPRHIGEFDLYIRHMSQPEAGQHMEHSCLRIKIARLRSVIVLCCVVLCCAVLCCVVLCCVVLYFPNSDSLGLLTLKADGRRRVPGCRPGRCLGGGSIVVSVVSRWCLGVRCVSVLSRWCLGDVSVVSSWCL